LLASPKTETDQAAESSNSEATQDLDLLDLMKRFSTHRFGGRPTKTPEGGISFTAK
jgi:hypothetical protein